MESTRDLTSIAAFRRWDRVEGGRVCFSVRPKGKHERAVAYLAAGEARRVESSMRHASIYSIYVSYVSPPIPIPLPLPSTSYGTYCM